MAPPKKDKMEGEGSVSHVDAESRDRDGGRGGGGMVEKIPFDGTNYRQWTLKFTALLTARSSTNMYAKMWPRES